jgi:hypothetical protein
MSPCAGASADITATIFMAGLIRPPLSVPYLIAPIAVGAAVYMANSNDASVGMEPAGTTASGRKIAAMEKPLATRTLIDCSDQRSI